MFRNSLVVGAVVVASLLVWRLRTPLLLLFAAIIFALFLQALAEPLAKLTRVKGKWSVALAALLLVVALGGLLAFFGFTIQAQITDMVDRLPAGWASLRQWLEQSSLGSRAVAQLQSASPAPQHLFQLVRSYASSTANFVANLLLVLVAGVYLALDPRLYDAGLLALLPRAARKPAEDTLRAVGRTLKKWLIAEAAAMTLVGVATGLGLWAIGVPAPIALGLLAGLADFVPIVGPIVAAAPALLLAIPVGLETVGWTLALFVVIQQLEGNVLQPMLQKDIVSLPPALTIFALVGFGVVFGPLGVLLATPMAAALVVAVQQLYVKRTLGEDPSG